MNQKACQEADFNNKCSASFNKMSIPDVKEAFYGNSFAWSCISVTIIKLEVLTKDLITWLILLE